MSHPDLVQRDARILRAAQEVVKHYAFVRTQQGDTARITVTGGTAPWEVRASVTWAAPPTCNCPDAKAQRNGGYCKHVIAVLLRESDLRCQLLELFV